MQPAPFRSLLFLLFAFFLLLLNLNSLKPAATTFTPGPVTATLPLREEGGEGGQPRLALESDRGSLVQPLQAGVDVSDPTTSLVQATAPTPAVAIPIDPDALRRRWQQMRQQHAQDGLLPLVQRSVAGRTIYVDANATAGGDGSAAHPFQTIRAGIDAAVAEDTVLVRPGIYSEIVAMKDRVAVVGVGKPEDVVIHSGASPIVFCADAALLQNLTIDSISSGGAGAIDCTNVSPILNRIIVKHTGSGSLALGKQAIRIFNTEQAIIVNSLVENYEDALSVSGGMTLVGNLIFGNVNWNNWNASQQLIADANIFANVVSNNTPQANQLYLYDQINSPTTDLHFFTNNWAINTQIQPHGALTLANNTVLGGSNAGIYISFPASEMRINILNNIIGYTEVGLQNVNEGGAFLRVENNLFWQNGENVQGLSDPIGKDGNVQADPQFVDLNKSNFHLTAGSPAIDAAQNLAYVPTDFDFESRMCDGDGNGSVLYDIGSDEYSNATCLPPLDTPTPTPTATPTFTATPTPTLTPTPVKGCRQLLSDPSFESNSFEQDGIWQLRIQGNTNIFRTYWPYDSIDDDQYVLEMDQSLSTTDSSAFVEQYLRLPPGEITFDLRWMREVQQGTPEPLTATLVDPASGAILQTLWTSPPEQTQWGVWHFVQLSFAWPVQQDVRLRIGGISPIGDPNTDFYYSQFLLDDVRLTHCAPTGQPTVTATPVPTVTLTPTPTLVPPVEDCQQLIVSPGFWPTASEWKTTGDAYVGPAPLFDSVSEPLIGYIPLRPTQIAPSAIYQTVHLPPQSEIGVEFYTRLKPEALNDSGPLQTGLVQIRNGDGSAVLATLHESTTAHPWTKFTYGLSGYAGQSVQVWFGGVAEPDKTATLFQIDEVYLTACPLAPIKVYIPLARKDAPPLTPTATPTATSTPTAIPEAMTPIPPPSHLQGGPLDVAEQTDHAWYLSPMGRVLPANAAEPFPLDPSIHVRALASSRYGALAATDRGVYLRDESFRWRRISETPTRLIASIFGSIWITPDAHPDQVWGSTDGGVTWQDDSAGLQGVVVSGVAGSDFAQQVLTLRAGRYVLWERTTDQTEWAEIATVPGAAVAYAPGGIPGGLLYHTSAMGPETRVSSSDGNLYRLLRDGGSPTWEEIHNFGNGVFPLLLDLDRVSAIDLNSGAIQLYQWQGSLDQGEWAPAYYPSPDLPVGNFVLPGGQVAQRIYGQGSPLLIGFVGMALAQNGTLYAGDLGEQDGGFVWAWRTVTETPERTDFIMAQSVDEIGSLYSGAHLQWDGSTCTADGSSFYRSDDKGLTWTQVASDMARQPVTALFGQAHFVLAATCAGPSLSQDGGDSWRSPADLGWPLPVGARHLALYNQDGVILYAAGAGGDGSPFLYRATYDAQTGVVGVWTRITPAGLSHPQAIFVFYSEETGIPQIYLADENTVWLSPDNGSTWRSRNGNLNGAQVRAFYPYENDVRRETGMLAATDRGLFFGPLAGKTGPWIPTGYPYTSEPVDFQGIRPVDAYLNGPDGVFLLPANFFDYIDPATSPTATPTSSVLPTATATATTTASPIATATPTAIPTSTASPTATMTPTATPTLLATPTATATPIATPTSTASPTATMTPMATPTVTPTPTATPETCRQLLINGGFENGSGWALANTAYPASYSTDQVYAGARSLRAGIPGNGANTYSYSEAAQSLTLPAVAGRITFSAQVWRGSTGVDSDLQYLWIEAAGDATQKVFQSRQNAQVWEPITYDLTGLKGKRITVRFGVYNNGSGGKTVLYVDEAGVESCTP